MQVSWAVQVWESLLVLAAVLAPAQQVLGVVLQTRPPPPPTPPPDIGNCSVVLGSVPSLALVATALPPPLATPIPSPATPTHPSPSPTTPTHSSPSPATPIHSSPFPATPTHSSPSLTTPTYSSPSPATPTHSSPSPATPTRAGHHGTTTVMFSSLSLTNTTATEPAQDAPSWQGGWRTAVATMAPRPSPAQPPTTSLPSTTLSRPTTPPSTTQPTPSGPLLSTTQPTPSPPRRQPTPTLVELENELASLIVGRLAPTLDEELAALLKLPYLERLRFTNHEMVDKVLQERSGPPLQCLLPLHHQQLHDLRRKLTLLLLSLPQSLTELQEGSRSDEVENYIFRPREKNILDVSECRHCYAKDARGQCRELFFCKGGTAVGARPRPSREELMRIYNG